MGKKTAAKSRTTAINDPKQSQKLEDQFLAEAGLAEDKGEDDVIDKNLKEDAPIDKMVEVDFWWTNLHAAKIGIYQRERFMAKNRNFTRNLDLIGAVKEAGKVDGMFGFEEDNWSHANPSMRRLIIKWFNSQSVAYLGTIEEMALNSLSSSIGANDTLPSFKVILPRYEFIVDLQKEHTRLRVGEIFTFPLLVKDEWHVFAFDEKRLTIGSDWEIKRGNKVVGKIDERVINVGGKFLVHFFDAKLYKDVNFYRTVILFTMMLKFKSEIYSQIKEARAAYLEGKAPIEVCQDEIRLLRNPRTIRR